MIAIALTRAVGRSVSFFLFFESCVYVENGSQIILAISWSFFLFFESCVDVENGSQYNIGDIIALTRAAGRDYFFFSNDEDDESLLHRVLTWSSPSAPVPNAAYRRTRVPRDAQT